jgi:hypothetical protein
MSDQTSSDLQHPPVAAPTSEPPDPRPLHGQWDDCRHKHGQNVLYLRGELRRLTWTHPQAVAYHGLCCQHSRRVRSVFGL